MECAPLSTSAFRAPANHRSLEPRAILYGYVARELFPPTCLALAAFVAVVLIQDLPAYTELVINRGAGTAQVAWIVACQSLSLVAQMLPVSVLVGGLVGLGRLVADREIMVLSALGLDPRRLLAPVAVFGGGMACLALAMSLVVSPMAQGELNRAVRELADANPFSTIEPDVVQRFGDWKLQAKEVSGRERMLGRVLLWMPSVGDTIFSQTARLAPGEDGSPEIELRNGLQLSHTREKPRAMRFEAMRARIPEPEPAADLPFEDRMKSLPLASLTELARDAGRDKKARAAESELHRRFAFPTATLLLGALSLPLVLGRRRSSRASGAVVGLAVTVAYYGLVQLAEGIAQKSPGLSALATWLPNGALLVAIGCLFLGLSVTPWKRREKSVAVPPAPGGGSASAKGRGGRVRIRRRALSRYVAALFLQLAALSLIALATAYLLVDVLERLEWFARHAASFDEIVHFYSARIPLLVSRVTPMGLVVAMALTVGLLTSTGELFGMRSLGISARQALLPALGLCLLATPLSFLLNDQIVPRTNELADLIKRSEIKQAQPPVRTAVWGAHGNTLYQLERLDTTRGAGRNVVVYELLANGLPSRRTDAQSMRHVGGGHWQLTDATSAVFEDPARLARAAPPESVELGEEPSDELDLMHLSVAELFALIREVAAAGEPTTELEVDLHVKLATPLACFVLPALVMLIASTGPPFPSSALTLILAGAIAVAYTLLAGAFASFGRGGVLAAWLGGWGPNLIATAALVGLTWRSRIAGRGA